VSIVVQDDGPGIPADERAKVITRFYRLDRSRSLPGNGLGLSIVAAISRLHGGTVSLADAHPGLAVRITLPAAEERSAVPDNTDEKSRRRKPPVAEAALAESEPNESLVRAQS